MDGAVQLATEYAIGAPPVRRAIGSFQAVQHLLADAFVLPEGARSVTLHASWAVDELPAADALAAAAVAKAYCARAARQVCETAIQVHGGIGNTWECLAHVYLRRALLSGDLLGDAEASVTRVLHHRGIGVTMDFVTHPRSRPSGSGCGRGWPTTTRACPTSSTDDDYWAGMAAWHQALYDAGFFGMSWPRAIGGQASRRLRGDRRRGAARPERRPGRASATWSRACSSTGARRSGAVPARAS
jgi:alkylation response protein AidB-like acyl-CoA dehydrogenase